jgi:superfamily II DNA or RNA helicase
LFQDEFRGNTLCTDPLQDTQLNWEQKAEALLRQRFGYKELKCFQKEALKAWAGHQDCLVLAATGSGHVCSIIESVMWQHAQYLV